MPCLDHPEHRFQVEAGKVPVMQISDAKLLLPSLPPTKTEQWLRNLQPGQLLQATALSDNRDGKIRLQIGASRMIAHTALSVKPGQALALQVMTTGAMPQLKVVTPPETPQLQAEALKTTLPRQRPLSALLETLSTLDARSGNNALPAPIKQEVQTLLSRLMAVEHPQLSQRLQTALLDSGLWFESRLFNQGPPTGDLKLSLLQLYDHLQRHLARAPLPESTRGAEAQPSLEQTGNHQTASNLKLLSELFKRLEGAIARIQTHQLSSLPQDDASQQAWQFELPVMHEQHVDLLHIRLKRDSGGAAKDAEKTWRLSLHMNLKPLGPMRAELTLQGKALSTVISAQRRETGELIEGQLQRLQRALEQAGLEVVRLQAYQRGISAPEILPNGVNLLSERA